MRAIRESPLQILCPRRGNSRIAPPPTVLMIHLKITSDSLDEVDSQVALILSYSDIRPLKGQAGLVDWRLNGYLSSLIDQERFSGRIGEALLMPSHGRLGPNELMVLGLGQQGAIREEDYPRLVTMVLERILLKKNHSISLSLSDLASGMFEWRNTVRLFMSMLSGRTEDYQINLVEPQTYVEDARRRHMDFAYDVQVQYR